MSRLVRNVPLLLQLFFWYTVITGLLPSVRQAVQLLPGVFLSKSGLMFPAAGAAPRPSRTWLRHFVDRLRPGMGLSGSGRGGGRKPPARCAKAAAAFRWA